MNGSAPSVQGHRHSSPSRGRRTATATAAGVLAIAALAAGCGPQDPAADALKQPTAPAPATTATTAPAAPSPTEDGKADGTTAPATPNTSTAPTPTPTTPSPASPTPAPRPSTASPQPEVLMRTGSEGPRVRELQARLRQIGHFGRNPTGYYGTVTAEAVRSFQVKRGTEGTGATDAATWQKLRAMTRTPTADELDPPTERPVAKPDERCLTGRVLCISKKSRTLAWMIDGRVVSAMDVRFGSEYTPTREGEFKVFWKSRDHVSTLYDTPMPYALFFSGGQAVHYSADFAANGYAGASHGCVNVRDKKKVSALFDQVKNGDKVVIYW
ncbi:murein L,D-transpeptidase [Streptomyces cavourensis]|uniref:Murein L,D-transpeptidase n=1 Tax=Streptomyces cavourensis TaxID=67258 RepID=A0AAD0QBX2_9ACTN|nr:murein L,D-transpeptidase [Streptomyces cavourensis]